MASQETMLALAANDPNDFPLPGTSLPCIDTMCLAASRKRRLPPPFGALAVFFSARQTGMQKLRAFWHLQQSYVRFPFVRVFCATVLCPSGQLYTTLRYGDRM